VNIACPVGTSLPSIPVLTNGTASTMAVSGRPLVGNPNLWWRRAPTPDEGAGAKPPQGAPAKRCPVPHPAIFNCPRATKGPGTINLQWGSVQTTGVRQDQASIDGTTSGEFISFDADSEDQTRPLVSAIPAVVRRAGLLLWSLRNVRRCGGECPPRTRPVLRRSRNCKVVPPARWVRTMAL